MNRKNLIGVSAVGLGFGLIIVLGQIVPANGDSSINVSVAVHASTMMVGKTSGDEFILPGLATRQSRRAFFSAPPVIPHTLGKNDRECLACHESGRVFKGHQTPLTPHPEFKNCRQCHVRAVTPKYMTPTDSSVETSWEGLAGPGAGSRLHDYAPPTIPHRMFLLENCTACHRPDAVLTPALPKEHFQRTNCRQCHVLLDNRLDF